jgi:tetratricopeptide (TPR) repeat protein
MKPLSTDKYSVAWFKLAEFVTRGEKERALGLFKLLMHSVNNQALAYQLQGDLLLSFEDAEALVCYQKSAELYLAQNKYSHVAAIYEHLLAISPKSHSYLEKLVEVYNLLNNKERAYFCLKNYFSLLLSQKLFQRAAIILQQIKAYTNHQEVSQCYHELICSAFESKIEPSTTLESLVTEAIAHDSDLNNSSQLSALLAIVKAYDEILYKRILEQLHG